MWWLVIIVFGLLIPEILSTALDSRLGRAISARIQGGAETGDERVPRSRIQYLEGENRSVVRGCSAFERRVRFPSAPALGAVLPGPPPFTSR